LPRVAALASQSAFHLREWETVAEAGAQLSQREPRGMLALAAIRTVVIRVIDVREGRSLELGIFHGATLPVCGCEHPRDNSYSSASSSRLYSVRKVGSIPKSVLKLLLHHMARKATC
jgi:hypothetical protein